MDVYADSELAAMMDLVLWLIKHVQPRSSLLLHPPAEYEQAMDYFSELQQRQTYVQISEMEPISI